MTTIALVGTESSGKTVLVAALARQYHTADARFFLEPKNAATLKYTTNILQLLDDSDWPPATAPGTTTELSWTVHDHSAGTKHDLRLLDPSGADVRALFGVDRPGTTDDLPAPVRHLADFGKSADSVLLLANLGDFVGEGDGQRRAENEWVLKHAMSSLGSSGKARRFGLVFTQVDLYQGERLRHRSWSDVARERLPMVHGAYLAPGKVPIFEVESVGKTRVFVDESGWPRRVPEHGFTSEGLDALMDWILRKKGLLAKLSPF